MDQSTLKVSFEGVDPAQAGLYVQELRNQILDAVPQGANVSLKRDNPEAMQFYETLVIDLVAAGLVHAVLRVIEHYKRPPGVTIRIEKDGKVVILDDVSQNSSRELAKLKEGSSEQQ